MPKANERQEGGNHYKQEKGNPEHWDLVVMYQWDFFQSQIIKYLMRWKDKYPTPQERLVDLKKGLHNYQKYLENWAEFDGVPAEHIKVVVLPRKQDDIDTEYEAQVQAMACFQPDGFGKDFNGYQCVLCRQVVKAGSPLGAQAAHACPGVAPAPQAAP